MDHRDCLSPLQKKRLEYRPSLPPIFKDLEMIRLQAEVSKISPAESLKDLFPQTYNQTSYKLKAERGADIVSLKVGVVFSGGQAAGGHNVIAGLFDALKKLHHTSHLVGFLDGPGGILKDESKEITEKELSTYRNQGGFDLIGSGRVKIETPEHFEAALKTCQKHDLQGLVIIGGDDSNTNAAVLAEYFLAKDCQTKVVGIPKTIDGDLRSEEIEISFGFDTACKIYSEIIGNIACDTLSGKKYYHFIKLMGRSASHIALECAMATHPNLTLIGEEKKSLNHIVQEMADLICHRRKAGKEYGVILIPEGLIEFIPEIKKLIDELNELLFEGKSDPEKLLSPKLRELFEELPEKIQKQLLLERDSHGNVQVSLIATEQLLIELVKKELKKRGEADFNAQEHFLGYEGRAGLPSNFDANYCYALGFLAAVTIKEGLTGMICAIQNLAKTPEHWQCKLVPIVRLMHFEMRKGHKKPVIAKVLVDTERAFFSNFCHLRKFWKMEDEYRSPGPIQFAGPFDCIDSVPISLEKR